MRYSEGKQTGLEGLIIPLELFFVRLRKTPANMYCKITVTNFPVVLRILCRYWWYRVSRPVADVKHYYFISRKYLETQMNLERRFMTLQGTQFYNFILSDSRNCKLSYSDHVIPVAPIDGGLRLFPQLSLNLKWKFLKRFKRLDVLCYLSCIEKFRAQIPHVLS